MKPRRVDVRLILLYTRNEYLTPSFIVVDLLASASSAVTGTGVTQPISDLEALEQSIKSVTAMLDRVLSYVRSVLAGDVQGDPAVGRYLLDTFAASTDDLEKGGFNASLQVSGRVLFSSNSLTNGVNLGHSHGVVLSKPCTISGRDFIPPCTRCNVLKFT